MPDVEAAPLTVEGILVESLADLRANKLTCILSRSEPRDLVDLMFIDRAGFPLELDLPLALRVDAGVAVPYIAPKKKAEENCWTPRLQSAPTGFET